MKILIHVVWASLALAPQAVFAARASTTIAAPAPKAASAPPPPAAAGNPPGRSSPAVTVEHFNRLVQAFRTLVARTEQIEKSVQELKSATGGAPTKPAPGAEEVVDLNALDLGVSPTGAAPDATGASTADASPHLNPHHSGGSSLQFKVLFDLNFYNRPGVADLTFDNFHTFLMAEALPNAALQFQFDVNPTPRWYELDYTPWSWITVRAGKIWIPFDDLTPHNLFGGRVNTQKLMPDPPFLPALWADLGVGLKFVPLDIKQFKLTIDTYVTNGFGDGGTDPTGATTAYPSFGDMSLVADNNRAKALGGRIQGTLFGVFGLGTSINWGRWSDESTTAHYATLIGADTQLRLQMIGVEIRSGLAVALYDLPAGATSQNVGMYGEVGWQFWKRRFKVLARGGTLQMDNRTINAADMWIVGGTLLYRIAMIEISIEHSRDLFYYAPKKNYEFTNLRLVVAL